MHGGLALTGPELPEFLITPVSRPLDLLNFPKMTYR